MSVCRLQSKFHAVLVALLFAFANGALTSRVLAQGANVLKASNGEDGLEADEGLESATPTDDLNELGNGSLDNGNGNGSGGNFQSQDQGGVNQEPDYDLFGEEPSNGPAAAPVVEPGTANESIPSAFGGGEDPGAANTVKVPDAPIQTLTPTFANPAPVPAQSAPIQSAPIQSAPFPSNAAPANAETLMNQIGTLPPAADPNASTVATGDEAIAPTAPPPSFEAPPLPPPNEFSGAPPVPGSMRLMADGEAPEEYRVQPGDTLFDICDQLLDEAGYWPKLWSLNPEIKNPHFIFPNMRLSFYPGDDDTPPYLQVVTEEDIIPIDKGELDEQMLVAEKVNFVVEDVQQQAADDPQVEVVDANGIGAELTDEILTGGSLYGGEEVVLQVPGFIFSDEREAAGIVKGGRGGETSLGPDQLALVEADTGVTPGTLYTVLRRGEDVKNPESNDFIGYRYYFVANMKILRSAQDESYVGAIQDSRLGVMADDILVPYISTRRTVPADSSVGSLVASEGSVIGFEYDGSEVAGTGQFVFIDRGSGDGMSSGMYVGVYATPGSIIQEFDQGLPIDYEMVGVIRIIDATSAGAVGYVVRNTKEIRYGDHVGKG